MKLEYQMLTRTEDCFKAMALEWSNSKDVLRQVSEMLSYEDVQMRYECILQLSVILLMP